MQLFNASFHYYQVGFVPKSAVAELADGSDGRQCTAASASGAVTAPAAKSGIRHCGRASDVRFPAHQTAQGATIDDAWVSKRKGQSQK